jgi:glucose-6-phosphate 1-dehydrogenase
MPHPNSASPLVSAAPEPCVLVIFGASGDLTHRKLIPSLFDLFRQNALPERTVIVGVSRTPMTDDAFRATLLPSAQKFSTGFDPVLWGRFAKHVHYQPGDASDMGPNSPVVSRINALAKDADILKPSGSPNILFYLSVSPSLYEPIIEAIGGTGLVSEGKRWCSINPHDSSWQRIIVEKPFGWDLPSASSLNRALGRVFEEDAIFRIDHYLGKEVVQNIAVMRFSNSIFEPLWNRTLTTCRSPPPRPSASAHAPRTTTTRARAARCATWCSRTCSRCLRWSRWSRRARSRPARSCGRKSSSSTRRRS